MASIAVSSSSKTRAVPVKLHIDGATPDALTTAPSGAREPRRMKIAPSGASAGRRGCAGGRGSGSRPRRRSRRWSCPETVMVDPSIRSPSSRSTAGTPPAAPSSVTPQGPLGASLASVGVVRPMRSMKSKSSSMPGLLRHRDEVQHQVGRAGDGQRDAQRVLEGGRGQDVARPDVLADQVDRRACRCTWRRAAGSWCRRRACPVPGSDRPSASV